MRFLITAGPCDNDARPEAEKPPDEAIGWMLKHPGGLGHDDVLEIRQLTELSDLTPRFQQLIFEVAPTWSAPLWRRQLKSA